jgi:3-oxoadipate enol-lactonase
MPTAKVNGIDIHYRDIGEGFPVVLLHGYTGNSRNWALTAPALADRFRVVSPDHRGHGLSEKPLRKEDYTAELMARDAAALLDHLGIEKCYLAGHSMGGMVAMQLIVDRPDLVAALILVDTAADVGGPLWEERLAARNKLLDIAREQGMDAAFEEQLRTTPIHPAFKANPRYLDVWREQFLMTSREAYIYCADAMRDRRPLLDDLRLVSVPTIIICGEKDAPFLDPSRRMHEAMPGSELVIIEGAGHGPQMETPGEFNRVLTGFVERVHAASTAPA